MIIYDVYRHDRSISPAALVRMSVKHWSRGLLTWRPVRTPQLQKVQAAMSVTYHRESEQNSPSVLVTQDRQPPSPEAFIRFQRLPGFRLLRKHATALTTLQGTVKPGRLKTQAHNPAVNQEDPIYAAIWTETHTETGVISLRNLCLERNLHVQETKGEAIECYGATQCQSPTCPTRPPFQWHLVSLRKNNPQHQTRW